MDSNRRKPLRIKKLAKNGPLEIVLEREIDQSDYDALTSEAQIATGVEQAEENEFHLQAALKGAGQSNDTEIPVPPPRQSDVNYDELYAKSYREPQGYIKFSDTVEETIDCLYDMTTGDDEWLTTYNAKKPANGRLSEDDFERIMQVFEETAKEDAPFASVDNTLVPFEVMTQNMAQQMSGALFRKLQAHAKTVYEYWKSCRQDVGFKDLHPSLKFETHQEHDDMDPYVCFRRREVRQTRKTRQRDVMVAEKLKKLRRELEDGFQLVILAQQREELKRGLLSADIRIFEQRAALKEMKVRLNLKMDDDDLYNTRPLKRKLNEISGHVRGAGAHNCQLRGPPRPDTRFADQDLVRLEVKKRERDEDFMREMESKAQTHRTWNQGFVDLTEGPLSPVEKERQSSFREARAEFLPTPPETTSSSMSMELDSDTFDESAAAMLSFLNLSVPNTPPDSSSDRVPATEFRRRIGRGGRLFIDRRVRLASPPKSMGTASERHMERYKYDQGVSDSENELYRVDPYGLESMRFRVSISQQRHAPNPASTAVASRQAHPQLVQAQANGQAQASRQAQKTVTQSQSAPQSR